MAIIATRVQSPLGRHFGKQLFDSDIPNIRNVQSGGRGKVLARRVVFFHDLVDRAEQGVPLNVQHLDSYPISKT